MIRLYLAAASAVYVGVKVLGANVRLEDHATRDGGASPIMYY